MELDIDYIRELRKEQGYTQVQISDWIGYSCPARYREIETKQLSIKMSYEKLLKLAMIFDVTPFDLVIEEENDYYFLER